MTLDELQQITKAVSGFVKKYVAQEIAASAADLRARLAESEKGLDVRVASLESLPTPRYLGVFRDGAKYASGSIVTRRGLWYATADTNETPGEGSTAWKLIVKDGSR